MQILNDERRITKKEFIEVLSFVFVGYGTSDLCLKKSDFKAHPFELPRISRTSRGVKRWKALALWLS